MDHHIECEGVWKIYGPDPAGALRQLQARRADKATARREMGHVVGVANVSLQIRRGEIFCIMGLSGSGKSTLLRHINRLIEPTAGRISVNDVDIGKMDRQALRRLRAKTIGMVFQHMALWPHRTLLDNVAYGLEVRGVPAGERRRIAADALALMHLDGWEMHYPDELSGGMQQRVGLARALAADPDILLMDEPFSALDPMIRRDLQAQFLDLSARLHKTTLFVTHDLDEAIRLGNRIAIMCDGEVVQVGTREEIILHPANDYVADFVRPISKTQFLKADSVMSPLTEGASMPAARVSHDAGLEQIMRTLAVSRETVGVEKDGVLIGRIDAYSLLNLLGGADLAA